MSGLGDVSLSPAVIDSGTTQSGFDSTTASISYTPFVIPTSTVLPTTFLSPMLSTSLSRTPTAVSYPSISAISLSSISFVEPTVTVTSTSIMVTSVVETKTPSTDRSNNNGFANQIGSIIGFALGGTFLLLLIILLVFLVCARRHSNPSYNSSTEDILAVSRNTSWRRPLDGDDDEHDFAAAYGRPISPIYRNTSGRQGQGEGQSLGDHLSVGSSSAENVDANGTLMMKPAFGGQPLMPSLAQTLHGSTNSQGPLISPIYSSNSGRLDTSQPWRSNIQPLSINKRKSSQQLPLSVDSHVTAIGSRSGSSLQLGGGSSSNGHGSSGKVLLARGNTKRISIATPSPIHRLSGRRHHSTPPSAFASGRDSSLEYGAQRIQQHRKERKQQDQRISQIILARLHASRRPSTSPTVKAYSQCTTIRSEASASSRAPSYTYSHSLLNPPVSTPQTVPRLHLPHGVSYTPDDTLNQKFHHRQGVADTSEALLWPGVTTLPPAPSPTDTASTDMAEGLLHPRLGRALAQSQQASATSLQDYEDYTRPINGVVNNHIRNSVCELQDTVDLGEGGT